MANLGMILATVLIFFALHYASAKIDNDCKAVGGQVIERIDMFNSCLMPVTK